MKNKRIVFAVLATGLAGFVAFFLAEVAMRIIFKDRFLPYYAAQSVPRFQIDGEDSHSRDIFERDPKVGYTIKKSREIRMLDRQYGYENAITSNPQGFRGRSYENDDL